MTTDIAYLGLALDSGPIAEGVRQLDRLVPAAQKAERATDVLRNASGALVEALRRNTAATEGLTAKMLAMEAAGTKSAAVVTAVGAAADTATGNVVKLDRATVTAKAGLDGIAASARNATAAWAALGAQGAATAEKLEIARRMASASAVIAPPPVYRVDQNAGWAALGGQGATTAQGLDVTRRMAAASATPTPGVAANQNAAGMSRAQQANLTNLLQQGADIGVTAAMGMSPLMILLQQGPQVAQSFAGPGALKIGDVFETASEKAAALAARIGIVGGAITGLTATVIAGVAAQQSYASTQTALAQQLSGVGRASGVTVGQINALAPAAAAAGDISVRSAREMAGEFAATGRIGSDMYAGLIATAKSYALTSGQDLPDATKALAAAFADPAKGADILNRQLGFLDAATRENIVSLAAQGDRLGAQRALYDAYKSSLTSATELTSGWAKVTSAAGKIISDAWDAVGQSIDKALTGGDLETRISDAERRLSGVRALGPSGDLSAQDSIYNIGGSRDDEARRLEAVIATLRKQQRDRADAAAKSDLAQRSTAVDDIVKQFSPAQERLKQIEQSAARIRTELAAGVLDPRGESRRVMDGLLLQAQKLKEDMAAGGSAYADALRSARAEGGLVGATSYGRATAGINEDAEAKRRQVEREAGTDATLLAARLAAIEEERRIRLDTATRSQQQELTGRGGAFTRAPAEIQQQILAATRRFPTVPPEILAAIGEKENGFRLSGPTNVKDRFGNPASTAWGFGQITVGAEQDIQKLIPGFDRKDPNQAVMGAAAYLSLRQRWAGGDLTKALNGYGTGPGYSIDIERRAGRLGDTSTLGLARERDASAQALKTANDNLRLNTELYGRNGAALEAQTRSTEQYNSLLARGVSATDAASIAFGGLNDKLVSVERSGRLIQAFRDDDFAREQLGRDRYDQQAYATARYRFGDTTSPEAQALIGRSRETAFLSDLRTSFTDAGSGFVTAMMRGANAATAFGDVLSRFADKAINSVMDSAFSAIFSSGPKGGGGDFFSGIAKVFGFADGGLVYGPGGPREDRVLARLSPGEFVVNAAATSRHSDLLHAINGNTLRGYADGGPIGWSPSAPANGNAAAASGNGPIPVTVNVEGANSDAQIRSMVAQGVAEGIGEYNRQLDRTLGSRMLKVQQRAAA